MTDQTSAHDELARLRPARRRARRSSRGCARTDPARYIERSYATMAEHMRALLELQRRGAVVFDYGNNLRGQAKKAGVDDAFAGRRLRAALHPAALLRGQGAVPLGRALGRSGGHPRRPTARCSSSSRRTRALARWLDSRRERIAFQGLPARICWLGYGERHRAGLLFNELVRDGQASAAPIVIGRDHLDAGSVASPNRETEGMRDGSDAIADWPILNALLNTAAGATWVSLHHGGGVGIGYSIHAGMVVVADGTEGAARRLRRVLTTRSRAPASCATPTPDIPRPSGSARERGVDLPFLD